MKQLLTCFRISHNRNISSLAEEKPSKCHNSISSFIGAKINSPSSPRQASSRTNKQEPEEELLRLKNAQQLNQAKEILKNLIALLHHPSLSDAKKNQMFLSFISQFTSSCESSSDNSSLTNNFNILLNPSRENKILTADITKEQILLSGVRLTNEFANEKIKENNFLKKIQYYNNTIIEIQKNIDTLSEIYNAQLLSKQQDGKIPLLKSSALKKENLSLTESYDSLIHGYHDLFNQYAEIIEKYDSLVEQDSNHISHYEALVNECASLAIQYISLLVQRTSSLNLRDLFIGSSDRLEQLHNLNSCLQEAKSVLKEWSSTIAN